MERDMRVGELSQALVGSAKGGSVAGAKGKGS